MRWSAPAASSSAPRSGPRRWRGASRSSRKSSTPGKVRRRRARAPGAEALYSHPLALYYAARPMTLDTALAVARRDVARRPAVESWDVLSWVLFRRGDLEPALAASDRARSWGAPSPTMDYHRARILEALGRKPEAAALLQRALGRPSLLEAHVLR